MNSNRKVVCCMKCVEISKDGRCAVMESRSIFPGLAEVGKPLVIAFGFPFVQNVELGKHYILELRPQIDPVSREICTLFNEGVSHKTKGENNG